MAMRLRRLGNDWIALCAAESTAQPGDVYLDDSQDHAIRVKLEADWRSEGLIPTWEPREKMLKPGARWPGETCRKCGRRIVMGFAVTDEDWKRVTGGAEGCWCLACFDELAQAAQVKYGPVELFLVKWSDW